MSIDSLIIISGSLFVVLLLLKLLLNVANKVYKSSLPETKFGFRGALVYTDDLPTSKVFVNHKYKLSAKPDFVFRTSLFKYTTVEYKSRNGAVKDSDIVQVKATIIAVRSKYNVTKALVVTATEQKQVIAKSSAALYRDIKELHKQAKLVKHFNKMPKKLINSYKCERCGYREHCFKS